jgi:hypothetical protein
MDWLQNLFDWFKQNQSLVWWLTIGSAVLFVATLLAIPWIVSRLPVDYFRRDDDHRPHWFEQHPAVYAAVLVLKNVLGAVLVLGGIAMLVLPGQGILSILIGTSLLSLPGKRRMQRWIVRRPAVMRGLNWIRRRAGKPPLEPPDEPST